jgi:precorrin-6B methylase 2
LLESLDNVRRQLSHRLWPWTLQQVAVHRAEPLAGSCRLAPINPVFIVSARKP